MTKTTKTAMTKKKIISTIKLGLLSLMVLSLFAAVTSCSRDEEKYDVTHKVIYKAEVSAGSNITSVQFNEPGREPKPAVSISGTTWVSPEITRTEKLSVGTAFPLTALADVKATGATISSTLKVQIYVDGILKKEEVVTGQNLKAIAQYDIEYKVN